VAAADSDDKAKALETVASVSLDLKEWKEFVADAMVKLEDRIASASANTAKVSKSADEVAKFKNEYTGFVEDIQAMYNEAKDDDSDENADDEAAMKIANAA
jgi:hypothetical protein